MKIENTIINCPIIESVRSQAVEVVKQSKSKNTPLKALVNTIISNVFGESTKDLLKTIFKSHDVVYQVVDNQVSIQLIERDPLVRDFKKLNLESTNIEIVGDAVGRELQQLSLQDDAAIRDTCRLVKALLKRSIPTIQFTEYWVNGFSKSRWSFSEDLRAHIAGFVPVKPKENSVLKLVPFSGSGDDFLSLQKLLLTERYADQQFLLKKLRCCKSPEAKKQVLATFADTLSSLHRLSLKNATNAELELILPYCTNLKILRLEGEKTTKLDSLKVCTGLESLMLYGLSSQITDISVLKNMENLKECGLYNFKGVKNIDALQYCTQLEILEMVELSDDLTDLSALKNMKELKVCSLLRLPGVENINALQYSIKLEKLSLSYLSKNLTDLSILENMKDLEECEFRELGGVKNIDALQYCTKLEILKLVKLSAQLTDVSILKNMKELIECELSSLPGVKNISALLYCTKLEILKLMNLSPHLDDISVLKYLKALKECELSILGSVDKIDALIYCP